MTTKVHLTQEAIEYLIQPSKVAALLRARGHSVADVTTLTGLPRSTVYHATKTIDTTSMSTENITEQELEQLAHIIKQQKG